MTASRLSCPHFRDAQANISLSERERRAQASELTRARAERDKRVAADRKADRDTQLAHATWLRSERNEAHSCMVGIEKNPRNYGFADATAANGALEELQARIDNLDSQLRRAGS